MSVTVSNSNYNGNVLDIIYKVFDTDNEIAQQGLAVVETGVRKKKSLPRMSIADDPFGDYTSGAPDADTATTTYAERELEPQPMMLFESFLPEDFDDVWEQYQPDGDFTNAVQNPEVLNAILELHANAMGRQISKLFFQGDDSLAADNPLNKFDGVLTRALADANVPKVTPAGNITISNVIDIVKSFWNEIPDKFIEDPDYIVMMNMTDYRLLKQANIALKQSYQGVLDVMDLTAYLGTRIIGLVSMKKNYIMGGVASADRSKSNFFMGVIQDERGEAPRIEKYANGSKQWFIRVDVKADANYRTPGDLLVYKPS